MNQILNYSLYRPISNFLLYFLFRFSRLRIVRLFSAVRDCFMYLRYLSPLSAY